MKNQEFISTIKDVDNTTKHSDFISQIAQAEPHRLLEIFKLIPKDWEVLLKNWQLRSAYERIIKATCLETDLNNLSNTYKIFNQCNRETDKNMMASMLTTKESTNELISELIRTKSNKLLQLVSHEIVSRGKDLRNHTQFNQIEQVNNNSPFSRLNLYPLEFETKNDFPSYSINGGGNGIAFGFQQNEQFKPIPEPSNQAIFQRNSQIDSLIDHWVNKSNGLSFGYRGEFQEPITAEEIIAQIPELSKASGYRIKSISTSHAFSILFNASSNGGAYSYGYYGAFGRLKTWESLNSMISINEFISNETTAKTLNKFEWYEFNTDYWFINEWLDLGIVGINETDKIFGLIGGTDTD